MRFLLLHMHKLAILGVFMAMSFSVATPSPLFSDVSSLYVKEGVLTEPVVELLKLDGLYEEGMTLQKAVEVTQKHWISTVAGAQGKERCDLKDSQEFLSQLEKVKEIAKTLTLTSARLPAKTEYDYGICLGAFLPAVRARLQGLVKLWKGEAPFSTPVKFRHIVFLTGERKLRKGDGEQDSLQELCNQEKSPLLFKKNWAFSSSAKYETEYDMIKLVWEQVQLPEDMEKALVGKVIFVNAPPKPGALRPTTKDTYEKWQEVSPPGSIIAVSSPFVWQFQQLVGENALSSTFELDTVSEAPSSESLNTHKALVTLVHDTVAKVLYEISQRKRA